MKLSTKVKWINSYIVIMANLIMQCSHNVLHFLHSIRIGKNLNKNAWIEHSTFTTQSNLLFKNYFFPDIFLFAHVSKYGPWDGVSVWSACYIFRIGMVFLLYVLSYVYAGSIGSCEPFHTHYIWTDSPHRASYLKNEHK